MQPGAGAVVPRRGRRRHEWRSRRGLRCRCSGTRRRGFGPSSGKAFSLTFSLHPGAEHDIADALDFYSVQAGPLVAQRFLSEFERVAKLLAEYPSLGTEAVEYFRFGSFGIPSYTESSKQVFESLSFGISTGNPVTVARGDRPRRIARRFKAAPNNTVEPTLVAALLDGGSLRTFRRLKKRR